MTVSHAVSQGAGSGHPDPSLSTHYVQRNVKGQQIYFQQRSLTYSLLLQCVCTSEHHTQLAGYNRKGLRSW